MALLRLRSEDGVIGLGEAVPLSLRGGASLVTVVRELEALTQLDVLDEAAIEVAAPSLSAPARCAATTALLDLRSRVAAGGDSGGSGEVRSSFVSTSGTNLDRAGTNDGIECNATLIAGEPKAVAEDSLAWAAEGFTTFKLKLGAGDDVARVRAVREAVGPEARIRVDVNAAWDLETAKRSLAAIEPFGIELAEQPVETLEELAELAAATSIPLAADESIESVADAERAATVGACEFTGIKLSKVGGPEEAIAIADVLPAYVSSALDGPVGIAAAAQVARTLAEAHPERLGLAHGLATQRLFASTVAAMECELRHGFLYPPSGPGLGVELDEDALQVHRL
jgi:L-alanine-DL-glutamate epimerase-like enolase superfamily enzyme